jgi:hypothetical protein
MLVRFLLSRRVASSEQPNHKRRENGQVGHHAGTWLRKALRASAIFGICLTGSFLVPIRLECQPLQNLLELAAFIQPQGEQVWTVKQNQKPRVTVWRVHEFTTSGSCRILMVWACGDIPASLNFCCHGVNRRPV